MFIINIEFHHLIDMFLIQYLYFRVVAIAAVKLILLRWYYQGIKIYLHGPLLGNDR